MKDLIKGYLELEQQMRAKTEEIKSAAKAEAMENVTSLLSEARGDEAKEVIDRLEKLEKLKLIMNTNEIIEFVGQMSTDQIPPALQVSNSQQFKGVVLKDDNEFKKLMESRGYVFHNKVQGAMRFEKESEFYYLYRTEQLENDALLTSNLSEAVKYCNLIYVVQTESERQKLMGSIINWLEKNSNEATRKYLKIQVGSVEKLEQPGTILEQIVL